MNKDGATKKDNQEINLQRDYYFEVFRLLQTESTEYLRFRSYRYIRDNHLRVSVDNYQSIFSEDISEQDVQTGLTVKDIRMRLEESVPASFSEQPLGVSDVISLTKDGLTSAYYVDPNKLILIPDFFHQPSSGALITMDTDQYQLDGRKGNWMIVDIVRIDGANLFLMQSQDYGNAAPYVIVDEQARELAADKNGFTEETIEQLRKMLKERETYLSFEMSPKGEHQPKLENWQRYYENGEYLRSAEITEEQNFNMIDGRANNRAPRRSVIERLQEKQNEVKQSPALAAEPTLVAENDNEIERNRKK